MSAGLDLGRIGAGFAEPVGDAQAVFRAVLDALARPGRIVAVPASFTPPAGVSPAAAAALLALADTDTPLWLHPELAQAAGFFRFHCGAPVAADGAAAVFALAPGAGMRLAGFGVGTPDYPDRSATVLLQVEALGGGPPWRLSGPGIDGTAELRVRGLPGDFPTQWTANRALFPCGVDVLLAAGERLAGLPRTVAIEA